MSNYPGKEGIINLLLLLLLLGIIISRVSDDIYKWYGLFWYSHEHFPRDSDQLILLVYRKKAPLKVIHSKETC